MVFVDATVVNIALPSIAHDLRTSVHGQTWIVNAYTLALASLILVGGTLGDMLGRRRVFVLGICWFAGASALCAAAVTAEQLIAARVLQGVGGALVTPTSLALVQTTFCAQDRAKAIGLWSGLTGVSGVAGPLIGGYFVETGSWRTIFLINVPVAVVVLLLVAAVPVTAGSRCPLHWPSAALLVVGLGSSTYGLTAWGTKPISDPAVVGALLLGASALALFATWQLKTPSPLLPPEVWRSATFLWLNAVTFLVYGAVGGVFLWLVIALQVVANYSPVAAGLSLLPTTVVLLIFSTTAATVAARVGPRIPIALGALGTAAGVALLATSTLSHGYWTSVFGPIVVMGLGLTLTVAPLTTAVLGALPEHLSGTASGTNNAIARTGALLVIAALPLVTGLGAAGFTSESSVRESFATAMWLCAGLLVIAFAIVFTLLADDSPSARDIDMPRWPCAPPWPPHAPARQGTDDE